MMIFHTATYFIQLAIDRIKSWMPARPSHLMASAFEIDTIESNAKARPIAERRVGIPETVLQAIDDAHRFDTRPKGIASLPDELLPIIFEFAVRAEGRMGATQAIRLSHVSRRFRSIALGAARSRMDDPAFQRLEGGVGDVHLSEQQRGFGPPRVR